jgi:hypothetical protein
MVFRFLVPDGIVPWVAVLGLWPVLHGRWVRLLCWAVVAMSLVRLAELAVHECVEDPAIVSVLAKPLAVLGLTSLHLLMPAGSLSVLMVAVLRLATGLRWPWRFTITVGAAGLAILLCLAWAGAFVAANTEGLGAAQPTLSRMLQVLRFTWLVAGVAMAFMSAMLVGLTRALARRLR